MAEPEDMISILPMLQEMRAEVAAMQDDLRSWFDRLSERFDSIERHHDECLAMLLDRTAARAKYLERRA